MNDKSNQSLSVTPPVAERVIVLASAASAARLQLPHEWRGWVTVQAEGCSAHVLFGGAAVVVNPTATTTLDGEEVDVFDGGEGQFIPEDSSLPVNLDEIRVGPTDEIFLSHQESATGGYLRVILSSGGAALS